MALDGIASKELEVIPLQEMGTAISEIGELIQVCGEADIAETVIVLTLTKDDPIAKPVLEVMFAGNPSRMPSMMDAATAIVKELAESAQKGIREADITSEEPWNYT